VRLERFNVLYIDAKLPSLLQYGFFLVEAWLGIRGGSLLPVTFYPSPSAIGRERYLVYHQRLFHVHQMLEAPKFPFPFRFPIVSPSSFPSLVIACWLFPERRFCIATISHYFSLSLVLFLQSQRLDVSGRSPF
jgi:hypothetical protein